MDVRAYICIFDLKPYDERVAPALRAYLREYRPAAVVALLREAGGEDGDFKHWADAIEPDAGYKPSDQTVRELCRMLLPAFCVPRGLGFNPMQDAGRFDPWLTERSEWFADLLDGGEELAGGRLEFSFGTDALIATREQIRQFLEEVQAAGEPAGAWAELVPDYRNLLKLLGCADAERRYTLLKTSLPAPAEAR